MVYVKALYTCPKDESTSTPALQEGEVCLLVQTHDSGWLEIETPSGER
eukprot:gene20179-16798_t